MLDREVDLLAVSGGDKEGSKKVCIGGFSQGAVMALMVGLEYDKRLGGIFCYSGFYSPFTK